MPIGPRPRLFTAALIGLALGTAPYWCNDSSPLWPDRFSDEAQGLLDQLMLPGFLFTLLTGRGPHSFAITVAVNVVVYTAIAYTVLVKSKPKPS